MVEGLGVAGESQLTMQGDSLSPLDGCNDACNPLVHWLLRIPIIQFAESTKVLRDW